MNVKKFLASTSREAWRLVREALGPDAVILSNRTVDGKVEILALPMEDMSSLAEPAVEKKPISESTLAAFSAPKYHAGQVEAAAPRPAAARSPAQAAPAPAPAEPPAPRAAAAVEVAPAPAPQIKESAAIELAEVMSEIRTEVMGEIRSMRGMLEEQLAEIAWSGQAHRAPHKTMALREMLSAG
ncbi:MAG: flagellar biosynthesis protein FlhF, partial [Bacillota bacterium]